MNARLEAEIIEVASISLAKVKIGKILTSLQIQNNEFDGRLSLRFDCGFTMHIDERGIAYERIVNRPNHDHCNVDRLMQHTKTKSIEWVDTGDKRPGFEIYRMEFGPRTVDW